MVTFRMMENGERYIVYWYFPDGDESSGHGIIVLDKENNTITIKEMAAEDFSHEISVKEQNELRDSVNEMKNNSGLLSRMWIQKVIRKRKKGRHPTASSVHV